MNDNARTPSPEDQSLKPEQAAGMAAHAPAQADSGLARDMASLQAAGMQTERNVAENHATGAPEHAIAQSEQHSGQPSHTGNVTHVPAQAQPEQPGAVNGNLIGVTPPHTPAGHGNARNGNFTPTQPASSASGKAAAKALVLRSAEFRKGREQGWKRLDDMVTRVEKSGITALSPNEVEELPLLYRATMSSLSVARNIVLDRNLLLYLENLGLRAYMAVYGPRSSITRSLKEFLSSGFPQAVRAIRRHLLLAFILTLAGVFAGFMLVMADINNFGTLVPEGLAGGRGPGSTAQELLDEEIFAPWTGFVDTFVVFANSLFRHNSMVGILCFCLGFALGIPTVFLLVYNGLVLGAFIALHSARGLTVDFIGWLSIHGVTELLAIMLCGAAGLAVAERIIFPGALPRLENLSRHGRQAASVAAGCVGMLFVAGILEGGFRQLINNTPGRYAFALVTGALWLIYFAKAGKDNGNGNKI